ncbi:hypothetical protein F5Y17DRAFT_457556 [Xylariaceae sp. FL0594]|nr:hypothetical protein F5Y17DRAFT_457556 [Xylariaceae sp. FL0594]
MDTTTTSLTWSDLSLTPSAMVWPASTQSLLRVDVGLGSSVTLTLTLTLDLDLSPSPSITSGTTPIVVSLEQLDDGGSSNAIVGGSDSQGQTDMHSSATGLDTSSTSTSMRRPLHEYLGQHRLAHHPRPTLLHALAPTHTSPIDNDRPELVYDGQAPLETIGHTRTTATATFDAGTDLPPSVTRNYNSKTDANSGGKDATGSTGSKVMGFFLGAVVAIVAFLIISSILHGMGLAEAVERWVLGIIKRIHGWFTRTVGIEAWRERWGQLKRVLRINMIQMIFPFLHYQIAQLEGDQQDLQVPRWPGPASVPEPEEIELQALTGEVHGGLEPAPSPGPEPEEIELQILIGEIHGGVEPAPSPGPRAQGQASQSQSQDQGERGRQHTRGDSDSTQLQRPVERRGRAARNRAQCGEEGEGKGKEKVLPTQE